MFILYLLIANYNLEENLKYRDSGYYIIQYTSSGISNLEKGVFYTT